MFALLLVLATIAGLPYSAIRTDAQGQIRRCTFDQDGKFDGATIPRRSIVYFTAEGNVAKMFLARDTVIENHACRGSGDSWETNFYPGGRLRLCWLAREETIDGIRCRRATIWADVTRGSVGVRLHESGRLAQCEAAGNIAIGSCHSKKGDTIRSDASGNITIRGIACRAAP